jgi:hypothetical protein
VIRQLGFDFRAALAPSDFLGVFPPVDFRAVCLVLATKMMITIKMFCYSYIFLTECFDKKIIDLCSNYSIIKIYFSFLAVFLIIKPPIFN